MMARPKDLTKDVREVLDYAPTGEEVITLYLAVDNARVLKQDYLTKLNSMITKTRADLEDDSSIDRSEKRRLPLTFDKIKEYVSEKFIANSTKTLLVYAKGDGIWKIFRLPVLLKSSMIVDPKPHTQFLRNLINNTKNYAVLMIDREKAQIASIYLGQISEYLAAFISDVPSKVNFRSEAVLREKKILGRIEEKLHHFFKYIDTETLKLFKENKFDNLILAGRNELLAKFRNYMHSYLQSRYIGDLILEPSSPILEIEKKASVLIEKKEQEYKEGVINRLLEEFNPNGWGVLGLKAVINALLNDQIKTLVYEQDFTSEGYVCEGCRYMTVEEKDGCPYCSGSLKHYSDIVDEIIEEALSQGCEIIDVSGNEKLKEAGNIGAVLRYKL